MGFHFIVAFALAWIVRGNLIAAALGTFVGNPITFPFIWAATYKTGHWILQTGVEDGEPPALTTAMADVIQACWQFDGAAAMSALTEIWYPILYPMFVGGLIVGLLVAIPLYFLTRRAALLFRENRRNQLMEKARLIQERAKRANEEKALTGQTNYA